MFINTTCKACCSICKAATDLTGVGKRMEEETKIIIVIVLMSISSFLLRPPNRYTSNFRDVHGQSYI